MSRHKQILLLVATALAGLSPCRAGTVIASERLLTATNVDWIALAQIHRSVREGAKPALKLPAIEKATYQAMRRAIWLAALHGVTDFRCPDAKTSRILSGEIAQASAAARKPFAVEIAVRDVSTGRELIPMFIRTQTSADLVGETNKCPHAIVYCCHGTDVLGEKTGIEFTSLATAANFARSCQSASDFVCEEDGDLAPDVFIRRFSDGSSAIVNLSDKPRARLVYRRGRSRVKFDFHAGDVLVVQDGLAADPFSQETDEPFISELWKVTRTQGEKPRIVPAENIGNVVSENYFGPVAYETTALIPAGTDVILKLETGNEAAEVFLDGKSLGTRAWEPFEWRIQGSSKTRRLPIRIQLEKRTRLGFLLSAPTWRRP